MINDEAIIITDEEEGQRIDKILAARFQEIKSRTYFQALIEEGLVTINGVPVKKRAQPKEGDEILVAFRPDQNIDLTPEPISLDIIYEDNDIIVINKPAGMVVHPAPGNWSGTFVNALLYHCQSLAGSSTGLRPGIVHRLDKETTGLLVAAKTALAQQRLVEMFASRKVYKEYRALCLGNPGNVEIDAPIGRHPIHRKMMAIKPSGGRQALSYCHTLAHNDKYSVVQVVLATGRTHQIRVHLKHIGCPILGDNTYGNLQHNKKLGIDRQMLHAYRLRFAHPISGEPLDFQQDVPEDMAEVMKQLRLQL